MRGKAFLSRCIYPNLRKWMVDNNITVTRLAEICGLTSGTNSIRKKLYGIYDFDLHEIKAILKESKCDFEYIFATK